ncbi:MAG: cell wall hydrolase [Lachnospiraceae bacterium]|nr:cell wall hydrolase [Lachnospiraceae bacterium]
MRLNKKHMAVCTAAVMTFSMTAGMTAMAGSDKAFSIDMTNSTDEMWAGLAMANDDMVSTGANIRTTPSEEGAVVGFLYRGGAVKVLNKGENWTEVQSGDLTGYIKNEYLTYGNEAKGLADYYGVEGVEASWNDVKVFADADANADIIHSVDDGKTFPVVEDNGHWLSVQLGADHMAYVSEEDVTRVLLVDEAVALDGEASDNAYTPETAAAEEIYTEDTSSEDTAPDYTEDTSSEDTAPDYTEDTSSEDTAPDYTEDTSSEDTAPDYTEDTSADEDYTEDTTTDESYTDDVYTDDDSDETIYDDGTTEEVEDAEGAEEYIDDSVEYTEETASDSASEEYTEPTEEYVEETEAYTEPYVEETEAPSDNTASSSDLDLLAAIIYCEAGNQSYEGMVAVGAVVMNRVASSSFPGSISEVIYQSGQFTPASSGALSSALSGGVPSSCYDAASAALSGENPVGGALYFNTGSGQGIQIGAHQFY